MELDQIDVQILRLLVENSRMPWKDIGAQIHMTGQAVGNRIKKLEDSGVIQAYTLMVDEMKIGLSYTAFIIISMKTARHDSFLQFIAGRDEVMEAHRISGGGCYHITVKVTSQDELNRFLDHLLVHGNYSLNLSIQKIKHRSPFSASPTA